MITAGIDVGYESIKIILLKEGEITGKASGLSGGAGRAAAIDATFAEALKTAGISADAVEKTVATGAGKFDVFFADANVTEPTADARAARYYLPGATSVVDVGADQTRVITLKDENGIREIALSQKCGQGLGSQLKYLARRFELTQEEFGALPADAANGAIVNDGCIVFMELDALELLNEGVPKTEVAGAVINAIATRINMVLNDKTVPAKDTTVWIGGVTKNSAVVSALKARSGIDFVIPEDAEYGGAVGCALIAAEKRLLQP